MYSVAHFNKFVKGFGRFLQIFLFFTKVVFSYVLQKPHIQAIFIFYFIAIIIAYYDYFVKTFWRNL